MTLRSTTSLSVQFRSDSSSRPSELRKQFSNLEEDSTTVESPISANIHNVTVNIAHIELVLGGDIFQMKVWGSSMRSVLGIPTKTEKGKRFHIPPCSNSGIGRLVYHSNMLDIFEHNHTSILELGWRGA